MVLNKYQLQGEKEERGYSHTGIVIDEKGQSYFVKWIKGIKKESQAGKIFTDKLRTLKKIDNKIIPKIIDSGYDEQERAYCIIYNYIQAETLEDKYNAIHELYFLKGIQEIAEALQDIQQNLRIYHEDLHPGNILIDDESNFFLVDIGLANITSTLSVEDKIAIFTKEFAAPEKFDSQIEKGFPSQSDIYSLGRVINWYFEKHGSFPHRIKDIMQKCCVQKPSDRLPYNKFIEAIKKVICEYAIIFDKQNLVSISFKDSTEAEDFMNELNSADSFPKFDINPKSGENILLNVSTENYIANALWLIHSKQLKILIIVHREQENYKWSICDRFGIDLGFKLVYIQQDILFSVGNHSGFDLTSYLLKIQKEKQNESSYRSGRKNIRSELDFYKKLLEKSKEVIEKNSLRLKYKKFEKKGDYEIWFFCEFRESDSQISYINNHIDQAQSPRNEGFEYILCHSSNKKDKKAICLFSGIPYDWDNKEKIIKFKDCENFDFDKLPSRGYLFENTLKQEEEKNRQLETIKKIDYNEVQNRDLIHYLFNPRELNGEDLPIYALDKTYQTDNKGIPLQYSYNQQRSIINAIYRKPITIIQGPPGTGKTTVITEIVFQLLNAKPDAKILITSQTNNAVDHVLNNLLKKEIQIVRLSGITKPKIADLQKHTLNRKIEGWKKQTIEKTKANWENRKEQFFKKIHSENFLLQPFIEILLKSNTKWAVKKKQFQMMLERMPQFKKFNEKLELETEFINGLDMMLPGLGIENFFNLAAIQNDWLAAIGSLDEYTTINQKLVDSIRVIGATCNHIAAKKYSKYNFAFDFVIMDESSKATTAEALVPIIFADNLVFVGDHRQLRPMLTDNREVERWLRKEYRNTGDVMEFDNWDDYFNRPSLFEQVITQIDENYKSQLTECRRSSADQVRLTSQCFYEYYGDEKIEPVARPRDKEHNLNLKIDTSIIFFDIGHDYKSRTDDNKSSYNLKSAGLIPEIIRELDAFPEVKNYDIGIITGYKAQLNKIKHEITRAFGWHNNMRNIKTSPRDEQLVISVVDKFQGLEKDIIIFDLVRTCHDDMNLGFLATPNRVNVALSRQKRLLIIIGDYTGIINAKSPKMGETETALQHYFKSINKDWIITNLKQVF